MDKFKAIETFISVVETEGFAAASRLLNRSAPTVSKIIKDLEGELGVLLIKRTTRNFSLTESGLQFYEDSKSILHKLIEAEATAKSSYRQPVGQLNISAPAMFGALHVSPLITKYNSLYPQVSVNAIFTDEIVDLVAENFDISFRIGELKDSSLIAKKVSSVRWIVCGSPEYFKKSGVPVSPSDLENHKLVNLTINDFTFNWKFKNGVKVKPKSEITVNSVLASKAVALSDWGIIQALSYQLVEEMDKGELIPVLEEHSTPSLPVHLVHSEGKKASAKIKLFSELVSRELKSDL